MDFRILGRLTVLESDQEVTLGGDRQRRVLAVLLASRGERVSTERLLDELWGEEPPATATTSLQVAVGKLRKSLGPEVIKTVSGGYLLDVPAADVDAARFEAAVTDAHSCLRRGDPARAVDLLRAALDLWRGDAYADAISGAMTTAEAARLNELRLSAVEGYFQARLSLGEDSALVPELTELVAEQPYRERLQRHLILALYRSGRQADALAAYTRVRDLLVDELGIDPTSDLAALEQQILGHDLALDPPAEVSGIRKFPIPPTGLVGRTAELDQVAAMVADDDVRVVTLTGPGGVGKTRLSLALLERLSQRDADPLDLFFVDLAPLAGPDLMLPTLADLLGVTDRPGTDLMANVVAALRGRGAVVVMDNFETVLDAGTTMSAVLAGCPHLTMVVTSRERLSVSGEHEFVLRPLPVPEVGNEQESTAVQLFCQRARSVQHDFTLNADNTATVAELCRQLDGLPLALELAAARSKLLTPSALLERLSSDHLATLAGGARDWPARHQTLERTIAWSYDHLDTVEKYVFQVCSAFAGGATLPAISQVAELDDARTLSVVGSLVDKSLLTPDQQAADDVRIRMLETVRQFAIEQLQRSGDESAVRDRHAAWFAQLATSAKTLIWSDSPRLSASVDPESDNFRAALAWLFDHGSPHVGSRMAADLSEQWAQRSTVTAWLEWMHKALEAAEPDSTAAAVLNVLTARREATGDHFDGRYLRMADDLATLRDAGAMLEYCIGLIKLAEVEDTRNDHEASAAAAEEAVAIARSLDLPRLLAYSLAKLALAHAERHDLDAAKAAMDEAISSSPPAVGDANSGALLLALSWVEILNGQYQAARDRLLALLDPTATSQRDVGWQMCYRINLAWAELGLDNSREAVMHARQGAVVAPQIGEPSWQVEALVVLAASLAASGDLDLAGIVLGRAKVAIDARSGAVDDYVSNANTQALAAADGPDLAANMARGASMSILEVARLPAQVAT